jgi:type II secretory pathway component PulF
MALEGGKAAWNAFKAHWGWFLLGIAALIIAALYYDHKNQGSLTAKVAGLPIVGKLFACLALAFGFKLIAARLLLSAVGSA